MQMHERIFELALKRSFFFPSNEPYGGTGGFYEYGPVGVLIKHKIENLWREMFIKAEGFHEIETSIITPEAVLVASGHVGSFADPVVECVKCKTRMRADTLAEEKHYALHGERWDGKLEIARRGHRRQGHQVPQMRRGLREGAHVQPDVPDRNRRGEGDRVRAGPRPRREYSRRFPRIFRNHGTKLPLAVGQVGKSFRNEISPRKGLVRMREFTQMELEYFFNPSETRYASFADVAAQRMMMKAGGELAEMDAGELVEKSLAANQIMAYFLVREWEFYKRVGIDQKRMYFRVLDSNEIPHYSKGNIDMEVETSYGAIETIGNAYRTDFDLSQHSKHSGGDLSVFVESEKKKVMPHVFELSMGVDRLFYCILEHCFRDKDPAPANEGEGNADVKSEPSAGASAASPKGERSTKKEWEWFDFPPDIAPYHVAVFPLMGKDGMDAKANELAHTLRSSGLDVTYRESGSIGRRYARADEIGVPYALTVDYDTLDDGTVTIRYRNDGKQERIKISECADIIKECIKKGKVTL